MALEARFSSREAHVDFIGLEGLAWISRNSNWRFPSSNRIFPFCTRRTNMSVLECYGIMIHVQHTLICLLENFRKDT